MTERNIGVTVQCYVKKDNKYLLLHRDPSKRIMPGVWMAPGGKRDAYAEGVYACSRREIEEETGVKIANLRIRATAGVYMKDIDQELFPTLLLADYEGGEVMENSPDGELVWLTEEEIGKLDNLLSELSEVLPFVFDETTPVISYRAIYEKGNMMSEFEIEKP